MIKTGSSDPPRQPGSILAAVQDALRENTDSTTVREESFAYQLLARLPSHDEARVLMDSFLRFSAWEWVLYLPIRPGTTHTRTIAQR